ncbi:helix-turn-helix transcriptional regulator [Acinetobacter sp. WCHAc060025]|uniref:helix-turn-helix transcriptional regulator n=1 Tax=Acinetobacter sp. WCHAc060025 TaxID=2518625 RepID=UPI0010233757|nr:AlpA family phage regulatory protein [Acinetobacter sp. WCHAc060025]RZG77453.1 AlpA family phage regulatory protein [Acinetobacter sp. WCHAc060025]
MATPIRLTFNTVCQTLSISRSGLQKLIKKDQTFPRPIKEGTSRQAPVYFDRQGIEDWHFNKCQSANMKTASKTPHKTSPFAL